LDLFKVFPLTFTSPSAALSHSQKDRYLYKQYLSISFSFLIVNAAMASFVYKSRPANANLPKVSLKLTSKVPFLTTFDISVALSLMYSLLSDTTASFTFSKSAIESQTFSVCFSLSQKDLSLR